MKHIIIITSLVGLPYSFTFKMMHTPRTRRRQLQFSPPWKEVEIDYSGANEYVKAHYGDSSYLNPYFLHASHNGGNLLEPIFDARKGVYDDDIGEYQVATLDNCGFSLHSAPTNMTNWEDTDQINQIYLRELEGVLSSVFTNERMNHVAFWNPVIRGEDCEMAARKNNISIPTSPIAGLVHIDADIGAYDSIEEFVDLVGNNLAGSPSPAFEREQIIDAITDGHRFAIVNFWRNINPTPVKRAPLAMLYIKYKDDSKVSPIFKKSHSFPSSAPDPTRSRWYTFPEMTRDECLVFFQYDRLQSKQSDVWHCALGPVGSSDKASLPRKSFDIRAFIVFDEKVSIELDRFRPNRLRPFLNLEESGCFCENQRSQRRSKTSH